MTLTLILAAMLMQANPELGPVLFRDLRAGETLEQIRARHGVDRFLQHFSLKEPAIVSANCKAQVNLGIDGWKKVKKLHSVTIAGHCPEDAYLMMVQKYGPPVSVSGRDYYDRAPFENFGDKYDGGLIGAIKRSTPNTTETTYVWLKDGVKMTLVANSERPEDLKLMLYYVPFDGTVENDL